MSAVVEVPLVLPSTAALFAVVHEPAAPREPGFVLCHPFAEEKLWSQRVFVDFARRLAAQGHPVIRFDHRGNGDSGGEFSDSTIPACLEDVSAAVSLLQSRTAVRTVGLVGLRVGALVAALSAEQRDDVVELVLWDPVVDGHRYLQEQLRLNLTTQMTVFGEVRDDRDALVAGLRAGRTVNIEGYEVGLTQYEELSRVRLTSSVGGYRGRTLVVQIDRGERPLAPGLAALAARYPAAAHVQVVEEPFWKEIRPFYDTADRLFDATFAWMDAR